MVLRQLLRKRQHGRRLDLGHHLEFSSGSGNFTRNDNNAAWSTVSVYGGDAVHAKFQIRPWYSWQTPKDLNIQNGYYYGYSNLNFGVDFDFRVYVDNARRLVPPVLVRRQLAVPSPSHLHRSRCQLRAARGRSSPTAAIGRDNTMPMVAGSLRVTELMSTGAPPSSTVKPLMPDAGERSVSPWWRVRARG